MFKREPKRPRLSPDQARRADSALGAVAAVDPKARSQVDSRLGDTDALWALLAPSEEVAWLQNAALVTDADGNVNRFTFAHGILTLTNQHLIFSDQDNSRSGHWPLTHLTTVNLSHNGLWRGADFLQINVSKSIIGFALTDRSAGQELVKRLGIAIAKARTMPSSTPATSAADELSKWVSLYRDGAISEHEFNDQKARLLGSQLY